jgi:hypothetical protein
LLPIEKKLYFSADDLDIDSLFDVAYAFAKEGGELLIIDEIHKYRYFEKELKKIYDMLALKVIFSGSSALQLDHAQGDLSRRAILYSMKGLSFREFIEIKEDITPERLLDFLAGNRAYIPAILAINKIDMVDEDEIREIRERYALWNPVMLSAKNGDGLESLKERIFKDTGLIRIYLKPQSGKVDFDAPLILRKGATVEDVCNALHRDFVRKFRYAMVWGRSVKFPGQHVGLEHVLEDEDVVRLVIRK